MDTVTINTRTSSGEGLLLEGVGINSCSKYFVFIIYVRTGGRVYTFHLIDSDYEEKQNYFSPISCGLVSTLLFSLSW